MFNWLNSWFNKNKNTANEDFAEPEEIEKVKPVKKTNNYDMEDNGDIRLRFKHYTHNGFGSVKYDRLIPKESIMSHAKNNIVCKCCEYFYNYEYPKYVGTGAHPDINRAIECKKALIEYKETQIQTLEYCPEEKFWEAVNIDSVEREVVGEKTPLELFIESYEGKYKLIETEDEFNDYLHSTLNCDTWCRMKLYNKMKELGFGIAFIESFADLIGNDLRKYHAMIGLASEVTDRDTLMYLYTYKFRE